MYYIKPCPVCGKKLRFPLDKGKLQIKCGCGNLFTADPDDTLLYKNGRFDLNEKRHAGFFSRIESLNFKNIKTLIITNLLDYKYSLQNFRLLTWKDRGVIIIKTTFAVLIVSSVIFLIFLR